MILGLLLLKFTLFNWLGIQSTLIFIDGIVHEWITSIELMINWMGILKGIIILLSVSMILNLKFFLINI